MKKEDLVSIIIPCRNSSETIFACLESIKNQSYKNIEIIVVDNNSTDGTKEIAKDFTNNIFNRGPERSAQRNYGAKKSHGKYLLFIDSDMELDVNVIRESVNEISKLGICGIVIPEESFGNGFWAQCKALERSFYLNVDWIEAPRFFEKRFFNQVNGYDENNTGTEDFDLPQRIKKEFNGMNFSRIQSRIRHNEGRLSLFKTLKKKFYYAQQLNRYKENNSSSFKQQANLFKRYALFFQSPKKLFQDPIVGIGMLLMKSLEFISGLIGFLFNKYKEIFAYE